MPLDRPSGIQQLLYYRDIGALDTQGMLEAVLQRVRGWSEEFRQITVYWIVSEHWDADGAEEHRSLYKALRQKARHEAWYIAADHDVFGNARFANGGLFDRCHAMHTDQLWASPLKRSGSRPAETR